jgi:hypothetical protein
VIETVIPLEIDPAISERQRREQRQIHLDAEEVEELPAPQCLTSPRSAARR